MRKNQKNKKNQATGSTTLLPPARCKALLSKLNPTRETMTHFHNYTFQPTFDNEILKYLDSTQPFRPFIASPNKEIQVATPKPPNAHYAISTKSKELSL